MQWGMSKDTGRNELSDCAHYGYRARGHGPIEISIYILCIDVPTTRLNILRKVFIQRR